MSGAAVLREFLRELIEVEEISTEKNLLMDRTEGMNESAVREDKVLLETCNEILESLGRSLLDFR